MHRKLAAMLCVLIFLENISKFSDLPHNFNNKIEVKNIIYISLHGATLYWVVPGHTSKRNTKSIATAISSQQISGKKSESK